LAFVWYVLLLSTDQTKLVAGLVRLRLPYSWGLTLAIALRYLPTMQDTYQAVYQAQQARGLVVRGRFLAAAKAQIPVLVAVLISALRTTDQLSLALQARGYVPGAKRTSRLELRLSREDYVMWIATVSMIALSVLIYS
jgi:energy-coupling factor transport system permease protein